MMPPQAGQLRGPPVVISPAATVLVVAFSDFSVTRKLVRWWTVVRDLFIGGGSSLFLCGN